MISKLGSNKKKNLYCTRMLDDMTQSQFLDVWRSRAPLRNLKISFLLLHFDSVYAHNYFK